MSACQATPTRQTIGFMTVRFILGLPCLLNTLQKKKKPAPDPTILRLAPYEQWHP